MTPAQCRAARGFLNWRIRDLAEHAGCHYNTVAYFENGSTQPGPQMVEALRKALEGQGIRFVGNTCQSALNIDPLSAPNIDPLVAEQARRCVALT